MQKTRIVFILFEFAPYNTPGAHRSIKLLQNLSSYPVESTVITLSDKSAQEQFGLPYEPALLGKIPAGVQIIRCDYPVIHKKTGALQYLDDVTAYLDKTAFYWEAVLQAAVEKLLTQQAVDFIYTSAPPFSFAPVVTRIGNKVNIPVILDMRDLWSLWSITPQKTALHYLFCKQLERKTFGKAYKVICATKGLEKLFRKTHPSIPADRFTTITNGFEQDAILFDIEQPALEKITVGYIGSFYYDPGIEALRTSAWIRRPGIKKLNYFPLEEQWLYRTPYFFLKAMQLLFQREPAYRTKIFFKHIGHEPVWLKEMVVSLGLEANYESLGFLAKAEILKAQSQFDWLLATSEKVKNEDHYCLPSKIFDYIKMNKPVLGFVTEGVQKEFIQGANVGVCVNPDDTAAAADHLEALFNSHKFRIDAGFLKAFNAAGHAPALVEILTSKTVL